MEEVDRKPVTSLREYLKESRESIGVFKWVWNVMATPQSKKKLRWMFLALGIAIALQCFLPFAMSYVFKGLVEHNAGMVKWSLASVFFLLLAQRITERAQERAREWVFGLHWLQLDNRITELFFEKSIGQFVQEGKTLSMSNIDKGRWKIIDLQAMLLFEGVPVILHLFVSLILLCVLSPVSGTIMTIVIIMYVFWSLYLNTKVAQVCGPIDKDFRALNRRRTERWERVERVKVSGKEKVETKEMSEEFDRILITDRRFWLWFINVATVRSFLNVTGLMAVLSWGAWLVWSELWHVGLLYPLFAWSMRVSENVWRFGHIEHQINWNLPSVKSMIKALELPPAIVDAENAITLDHTEPHEVVFEAVSHTYPPETAETTEKDEQPPALRNVSFKILPGEKVALIGPSGGGKSTAMKKLLRFDDPTSGRILIGGVDLKEITQASWRRGIGYIPQQSQVFDGTIRYNLTYSLTDEERAAITDDDLWTLMKLLQIDFGDRLTKGLDTVVGKSGLKLSGGQAQRLMIGAAVIKKPWLLVVDEATSSLDSTTEKKVHDGLKAVLFGTNTSALIVAHRLSTVRDLCTRFIVLKSGSDIKNGDSQIEAIASSFQELYAMSVTFRQLADDQGIVIKK